jgi:hypothetical protein
VTEEATSKPNDDVTVEDLKKALPATLKQAATQDLADKLNQIRIDPLITKSIRDNFIGYTHVLKDGRFKTDDYLSAVTYVSFKLMGLTNKEAYENTFPERMQNMIATGKSSREIAAYVATYAKGKLVNLIYEQSMVPSWVLNQDVYQEAINTQLRLMRTATSEKVQAEAANSILTHLKKPEVKEFQLSIETKENSGMREMQELMRELATKQLQAIDSGTPTHLIAAQPIADRKIEEGEFTDVSTD